MVVVVFADADILDQDFCRMTWSHQLEKLWRSQMPPASNLRQAAEMKDKETSKDEKPVTHFCFEPTILTSSQPKFTKLLFWVVE